MKEKQLYTAINKLLPPRFHSQALTGASMHSNGTPDRYYDPEGGNDLWVEFKQLTSMPRSGVVIGDYTSLQSNWMERRYRNSLAHGRPNMVGIVGLPNRTAVIQRTPTEWREGTPVTEAITLKEAASWIEEFCLRYSVSSAR